MAEETQDKNKGCRRKLKIGCLILFIFYCILSRPCCGGPWMQFFSNLYVVLFGEQAPVP